MAGAWPNCWLGGSNGGGEGGGTDTVAEGGGRAVAMGAVVGTDGGGTAMAGGAVPGREQCISRNQPVGEFFFMVGRDSPDMVLSGICREDESMLCSEGWEQLSSESREQLLVPIR